MITRIKSLCIVASVLVLPVTAQAQSAPPSAQAKANMAAIANRAAECLAKSNRLNAVRMLEAVPGSTAEARAFGVLTKPGGVCLPARFGGQLPLAPVELRGLIAEELFESDFSSTGQAKAARFAALPNLMELGRQPNLKPSEAMSLVMGAFASCVVEARPAEATELLTTSLGSAEEKAAFERLSPSFGACFPAGQNFRMNRSMLRGFLAEGVYRHWAALARGAAG